MVVLVALTRYMWLMDIPHLGKLAPSALLFGACPASPLRLVLLLATAGEESEGVSSSRVPTRKSRGARGAHVTCEASQLGQVMCFVLIE